MIVSLHIIYERFVCVVIKYNDSFLKINEKGEPGSHGSPLGTSLSLIHYCEIRIISLSEMKLVSENISNRKRTGLDHKYEHQ